MSGKAQYRIYTTAFDAEIDAGQLLQSLVDEGRIDLREWRRPAEEVAIAPPPYLGTRPLVTLLVDHSGSLRGAPADWVISALRKAGSLLENSNIAFELLGYTTVHWQGGRSKQQWLAGDYQPFPGRLCDLLHIVYQDAGGHHDAWSQSLSLMKARDVLKENIDGEALLWACQRARAFEPSYWLCVVVSDGAPVDDSTLEANADWDAADPHPILHEHLVEVIGSIDVMPNTQIAGFGINYDVSAYYEDHDIADTESDDVDKLSFFVQRLLLGD